jgi:hypothetical protein
MGVAVIGNRATLKGRQPILRSRSPRQSHWRGFGAGCRRLLHGVERPHGSGAGRDVGRRWCRWSAVLIRDQAGAIVGAVGVSGDTSTMTRPRHCGHRGAFKADTGG